MTRKSLATLAVFALTVLVTACGPEGVCTSPEILPSNSPAALGTMQMLPAGEDPNPGANNFTPFEWTLQLQSSCAGQNLKVEKVCKAGDPREAFLLEGPEPEGEDIPGGASALVRVTYDPDGPNSGEEVDQMAVVVQSNATNFPTLVVPVCARAIPEGGTPTAITCESPVSIGEGEKDESLCE
jgi:hypothetical protein